MRSNTKKHVESSANIDTRINSGQNLLRLTWFKCISLTLNSTIIIMAHDLLLCYLFYFSEEAALLLLSAGSACTCYHHRKLRYNHDLLRHLESSVSYVIYLRFPNFVNLSQQTARLFAGISSPHLDFEVDIQTCSSFIHKLQLWIRLT